MVITDRTPFYAESGGQEADCGSMVSNTGSSGIVIDVKKQKDIFMHTVKIVNGIYNLVEGTEVQLTVDSNRRSAISKNHSATHLLQKALREVLGTHVQQAGSLVSADRLRFDFNHYEAVSAISKNHSATHLLQKALREVLGTHVQQAGSLVSADRLRFDFNHYEAVTDEELEKVERLVNAKISEAVASNIREMSMDEAKKLGQMKN